MGKKVSTEIGVWDFERVGHALYRFAKANSTERKYRITAVTGPRWLLGRVGIQGGTYRFLRDGDLLSPAGDRWGVYYPPHSLCRVELDCPRTVSEALWGPGPPPEGLPLEPVIFDAPDGAFPASIGEMAAFIRAGHGHRRVGTCSAPSPLAERLKRAIDRPGGIRQQIADHADELGSTHSQLTRAFRKDYGITPVEYRSALRVEEGILRLLEGQPTLEACFDSGFSDLSRFNRTLKKVTTVTPSRFRVREA